jgi:uncharacterized membrane protein YbhN (UPF0104 family)
LNTIIELVLRVAGLVEAEGRVAKRAAVQVAIGICIFALATVLVAVGLLCIAAAIFLALAEVMHPAAALLTIAVIVIAAAVGCAFAGKAVITRRAARKAFREKRSPAPRLQPQPQM